MTEQSEEYKKGFDDGVKYAHDECYDTCACYERGFDDGYADAESQHSESTVLDLSMHDIMELFHRWSVNKNVSFEVTDKNAIDIRDFIEYVISEPGQGQ